MATAGTSRAGRRGADQLLRGNQYEPDLLLYDTDDTAGSNEERDANAVNGITVLYRWHGVGYRRTRKRICIGSRGWTTIALLKHAIRRHWNPAPVGQSYRIYMEHAGVRLGHRLGDEVVLWPGDALWLTTVRHDRLVARDFDVPQSRAFRITVWCCAVAVWLAVWLLQYFLSKFL